MGRESQNRSKNKITIMIKTEKAPETHIYRIH
jgi:hypothetical protein